MRKLRPAVLAVVSIVATFLAPVGAGAQVGVPVATWLEPSAGDVVFGEVHVALGVSVPPGQHVMGVSFAALRGGDTLFTGFDATNAEVARGPECEGDPSGASCADPNVYSADWMIQPSDTEGMATLVAQFQFCDHFGCRVGQASPLNIYVEPTPPIPSIVLPGRHSKQLPVVPFVVTVPDDNVTSVVVTVDPIAFTTAKGIPSKDQHVDGVDVSKGGKTSCGPTAAGASLAWFADHGHPDIMEDPATGNAISNRELVKRVGNASGMKDATSTAGVSDAALEQGIKDYLNGVGEGGNFDVGRVFKGGGIPGKDIQDQFQRKEDVLIGFTPAGGGMGHWLTVNNVTQNADGSYKVNVMDPADGTNKDINVDGNGTTNYGGGGKIDGMIHVSEKKTATNATPSVQLPFLGDWLALYNGIGQPFGDYIATVTATDATGVSFASWVIFTLDP